MYIKRFTILNFMRLINKRAKITICDADPAKIVFIHRFQNRLENTRFELRQ